MFRVVCELRTEGLFCFIESQYPPEQVAISEMDIRHGGISLNRSLKLGNCAVIVFQLVVGFPRKHICFGRLRIQREDLTINIEHTLVLPGAETALGQRHPEREISGVGGSSLLQ